MLLRQSRINYVFDGIVSNELYAGTLYQAAHIMQDSEASEGGPVLCP
jgi:hypothetical protein